MDVIFLHFSKPSGFHAYLPPPTPTPRHTHTICMYIPLQGAVRLSLYQLLTEVLPLPATVGNVDLTAWYSNNVMKFNIYCSLGRLCMTLINKLCHDRFKKENLACVFFFFFPPLSFCSVFAGISRVAANVLDLWKRLQITTLLRWMASKTFYSHSWVLTEWQSTNGEMIDGQFSLKAWWGKSRTPEH